jgi:zinc protease
VPSNDKIILEKSFRVLADWASEVSFDEASLENEKKVIVEEWRQGLGLSKRKSNLIIPILYANSKYKDRLPIGDLQQINKFTTDDLKEFYQEWYRPNLMSLVAVGDFNTIEIEKLIYKYFDNLKNPINSKERIKYFIPNPENKPFVDHKDGNKINNQVSNLHWVTAEENSANPVNTTNRAVIQICRQSGKTLRRFSRITEAAKFVNGFAIDIRRCCLGAYKHSKGFKWKYED